MNLKNWMETVGYKITEGGEYGWSCYGSNAYCLDSYSQGGQYSTSVIFDTVDQKVYEVSVCDEKNNRAYRIIDSSVKHLHKEEAAKRNVVDEAWEDVKWTDLELFEDWEEKAKAIIAGEEYDTRILVPLTLEQEELDRLMEMAKAEGITLDALVEKILLNMIETLKQ